MRKIVFTSSVVSKSNYADALLKRNRNYNYQDIVNGSVTTYVLEFNKKKSVNFGISENNNNCRTKI